MKITIAQLNPTVGDITGNLDKVKAALGGTQPDTDLIVFPELFLTGCHPRDLLEKPWFIEKTQEALRAVIDLSTGYPETGILLGIPVPTGLKTGKGLSNSAVLIYRGDILLEQPKSLLFLYDVSDEARYFAPPGEIKTIAFKDEVLGISISEDAWNVPGLWEQRFYPVDPLAILAEKGASIFINIAASPFTTGIDQTRFRVMRRQAREKHLPLLFVNMVGGNDELIFDGGSFFLDRAGKAVTILPAFEEALVTIDTTLPGSEDRFTSRDKIEAVHDALLLGIRDYITKCGFFQTVIGLSGGIDSAVTCSLAQRAIGSDNIFGLSMPSPYTSPESESLARQLSDNLGITLTTIPISSIYQAYLRSLEEYLPEDNAAASVSRENIQARIRGNILMAFSNRFGSLVLSTGNKSETATGYCTLYGDLTGGLAVLSDVPKTMVYELAAYINREVEIIPRGIIERAPSAELKPDQTDQDTLPPYPLLDRILYYYIEEGRSGAEIARFGIDPEMVEWVIEAVNKNEYKRRQAPPGLKVTGKAFGAGRRMPIAAKY
ncbi:MAG: NAD+ synthase [Candidatus Euphemobacter frigidus]|nr:NAD+ synthase [Candidatus Euphemobacter frigidus]MDP8275665.1 NAD+ synthase [Candidatus Euphemobacter frigidus]